MRCCGCWNETGYLKAKEVIKSCETLDQLNVAKRYAELSLMKVTNSKRLNVPFKTFIKLKQELQKLIFEKELEVN